MFVYIFKDVDQLTNNYHSEGGLVIVAKDDVDAQNLIDETNAYRGDDWVLESADIQLTDEEWNDVIIIQADENAEREIFVFPDAGCC